MKYSLSQLNQTLLASFLELSLKELEDLAQKAPKLYRCRKEPKKNGGFRTIEAPHGNLKSVQKKLLAKVITRLPVDPMLFGGKGSSVPLALRQHVGKPMVVTLDIKNFFPSVSSHQVHCALRDRGASKIVADLICRLTTRKHRLPQGAPTSPALARLALSPVTRRIKEALDSIDSTVDCSIYVDDVTLSGPTGIKRLKGTIINIIERHGFKVHPDKIKIMPATTDQESLGCLLNTKLEPNLDFQNRLKELRKIEPPSSKRLRGMEVWQKSLCLISHP